jgi:hypothetical protein
MVEQGRLAAPACWRVKVGRSRGCFPQNVREVVLRVETVSCLAPASPGQRGVAPNSTNIKRSET